MTMKFFDFVSSEEIISAFDDDGDGDGVNDPCWSLLHDDEVDRLLAVEAPAALNETVDEENQQQQQQQQRQQHREPLQENTTGESVEQASRQSTKRGWDGNSTVASQDSADDVMQSPPPDQFDGELLDAERQQAREINALSLQERETLYEDIHGVRRPIEETEEFRQEHLQRLETELTVGLYDSKRKYKLPIKNTEIKEAYIITSFLAPRITSDVNLRLTMLRATHWDVQEAAMKTMKYFHAKQKLFGKEVCLRPLVFGDLQQDAQESMEQGAFKIHDDGEGICFRPMMLNLTNRWKTGTALSLAQAIFYSTHMFGRTVRAQQRGVVGIIYTIGTDLAHFRRALAAVRFNMIDATPMRPAGMHMCFSNTRIKPVLSAVLKALPKAFRIRFKLHFGSPRECNRELMTYGVPASLLPDEDSIACGGVAVPEMITKCLARDRDALQRYYAGKPKECIEGQPQPRDILLGRGRPYQKYPGNMDFAQLLQKRKTSYNDPLKTKSEKTELTKQLVKELRDAGVRFLKRDKSGDWWQEVPDTVARERVAMSLRNLSRK